MKGNRMERARRLAIGSRNRSQATFGRLTKNERLTLYVPTLKTMFLHPIGHSPLPLRIRLGLVLNEIEIPDSPLARTCIGDSNWGFAIPPIRNVEPSR